MNCHMLVKAQQRMNKTTKSMWLTNRFAPIIPKVKGMMRRIRGYSSHFITTPLIL